MDNREIDDLVEGVVKEERGRLIMWSFFTPLILSFFVGLIGGLIGANLGYVAFFALLFQFIGFIDSFFKKPQKNMTYKHLHPSEKEQFLRLFRKEVRGGCVGAYVFGFFFWNIIGIIVSDYLNL